MWRIWRWSFLLSAQRNLRSSYPVQFSYLELFFIFTWSLNWWPPTLNKHFRFISPKTIKQPTELHKYILKSMILSLYFAFTTLWLKSEHAFLLFPQAFTVSKVVSLAVFSFRKRDAWRSRFDYWCCRPAFHLCWSSQISSRWSFLFSDQKAVKLGSCT